MRKIIHIDCDCFYAALEMRDNPQLRGIPLAVGGSPDKRGVVATCSYEARSYGIHSAMAMRTALRLYPALTVVHPRFDVYRAVSRQIQAIFRDYTDIIEPLSLDEAYLDVSDSPHFSGSATRIAEAIRRRVADEISITVSAGVAPNKFLAKIASDWRKPDGLFVIVPADVDAFVAALPVSKLHGVGRATGSKLTAMGIDTCADLRRKSQLELVQAFGSFGERLWKLAHGIDDRPVQSDRRRQSVSVEQTYTQDLPDLDTCLQALPELLEKLEERIQRLDTSYRPDKPFVKIKFHDFTQTTLEQSGAERNLESYRQLLAQAFARGNRPVRLIGVGTRLLDLRDTAAQLGLF